MYQIVATNLELARKESYNKALLPDRKVKEGDEFLLRDHPGNVKDPRYAIGYRILSFP